MQTDSTEAIRLIQSGLDRLGHAPGTIDGRWGVRTARTLRHLIAANGRPASLSPQGPLPWITEAKAALGRNEARDRTWLMDWLKRDGRSLGDPSKNPWCGDFVETCIRMGLPNEPLLGALSTNPYWARNWLLFGQETKPVTGAVLIFTRGSGGMSASPSARMTRISTSSAATSPTPSPSPTSPSHASLARAGPQPTRPACNACRP